MVVGRESCRMLDGKGIPTDFVAISHKIARFARGEKLAAEKSIRARSFTR